MSDSDDHSAPEHSSTLFAKGVSSKGGGRRGSFPGRPREYSGGGSGVLTRSSLKKAGGLLETEETPPATNVSSFWDTKESASRKPDGTGKKVTSNSASKVGKSFKYGVPDDSDVSGSESYSSSGGSFKNNLDMAGSMMKEKLARPESYVDLTGPDCCRVRMRKTMIKGRKDQQVAAVCGLSIFNCTRRGHENKRAKGLRGDPGFYFICHSTRGTMGPNPDGRADVPFKTSAELADMAADIRKLLTESVAAVSQPTSGDSIQGLDLMSSYSRGTGNSEVRAKDLFSPDMDDEDLVGNDDSSLNVSSVGFKAPPTNYVGEDGSNANLRVNDPETVRVEDYEEDSIKEGSQPGSGQAAFADAPETGAETLNSEQSTKLPFQSPVRSPPKFAGLSSNATKSGGKNIFEDLEFPEAETSGHRMKPSPPFSFGGEEGPYMDDRQTGPRDPSPIFNKTHPPPKNPAPSRNNPASETSENFAPFNDESKDTNGPHGSAKPETVKAPPPVSKEGGKNGNRNMWVGFINRRTGSRRLECIEVSPNNGDLGSLKREGEDLVAVFSVMNEAFLWLEEVVKKPPPAPVKPKDDKSRPPTPYIPINYDGGARTKMNSKGLGPGSTGPPPTSAPTNTGGGYDTETSLGTEATHSSKKVGFQTPIVASHGPSGSNGAQLWYGLVFRVSAQRIVVTSPSEVAMLCNGNPAQADLVQTFTTYEEALDWSMKGPKKANNKKKDKDGGPPPDDSSSSSSSGSSSSSDSGDDSSGSSFDWDANTKSSSSDDSDRKRRRKQDKKKHKSKDKKRKETKSVSKTKGRSKNDVNLGFREKVLDERLQGEDPSIGKDDEVYGSNIADENKLNKKLCPPDLSREDRAKFLQLSPDITSLPGMYLSASIETSMEYEMVSISLAQSANRKGSTPYDTMWRHKKKHSLGTIKSQEDLVAMVEQVDKAGKFALAQFKDRVRAFMLARRYSKNSVTLYLQAGLLPKIIQITLRNFQLLLEFFRSLSYKHGFEGGPARHLLSLHSERLGEKRYFAYDYRYLVLGSYVYLREAHNKSFAVDGLLTAVWDQIHKPPTTKDTSTTPPTRTPNPACSHCKTKAVHEGGKSNCNFKELSPTKAKAAAREVLAALGKDSSLDKSKLIADVIKKAKD